MLTTSVCVCVCEEYKEMIDEGKLDMKRAQEIACERLTMLISCNNVQSFPVSTLTQYM